MNQLKPNEYLTAARVFADGFLSDPAFSLVLQGFADARQRLERYFLNYFNTCKELSLYRYSETEEAYLCLYHWDTAFEEFEIPAPLEELERFQILEEHYSENFAVLDILTVAPESRGKGLAGEMIDYFVEHCRERNLLPLVEVFSERHLSLYRAHGFEVAHFQKQGEITTYLLEYHL